MTALPPWAVWSPAGAAHPWTVGLEEEALLLAPPGCSPANRIGDVLEALPPELARSAASETHACVIELMTRPHVTVAAAAAELRALRAELATTLAGLGLQAAGSGTHPLARWTEVDVTASARARRIHATMRELARREPTCALHVHVAVPDGETAARALAGLREDLPLLLALSANSPFWQGRDSGLASARTPIFSMFPRVGIPRRFAGYGEYVAAVDSLIRCGAIAHPSWVWWDARLRPSLGTVEVRIMDAQSRAADTAALAALVQCLVRLHATRDPVAPRLLPEALDENRFRAARDGIAARFLAPGHVLTPARAELAVAMRACRVLAAELGCDAELAAVAALAADPGHTRQRGLAARRGLAGLPAALADEYAPAVPHAAAALAYW